MRLKRVNSRPITYLTLHGYLTYTRYILSPEDAASKEALKELGKKSVVPMDEYLSLDNLPFKVSPDMAAYLAKECIKAGSYAEVEERMLKERNIAISDDQLRKITDYIGELVYQADEQLVDDLLSDYSPDRIRIGRKIGRPRKCPFIIYIETDGSMYHAREEGDTEKGWHETKLGIVFTSDSLEEYTDKDGNLCYRIIDREYISNNDGVENHRRRLAMLAIKHGLYNADQVVILSDGADWIRKTRDLYFPYATSILDLFHLKENVHKFAEVEFGVANLYTKIWADRVCALLEAGKWEQVLTIRRIAAYADGTKKVPKGTCNLYSYIWNNRDRIDYPKYREKGYFCGSGAIESGHKKVVHGRIKLSGMRWLPSKARGIVTLRCKYMSNLWDLEVVKIVHEKYKKLT